MMLPDPRPSVLTPPKNGLLDLVAAVLTATEAEQTTAQQRLQMAVAETLMMRDQQSLALALQFAPSQEAYKTLWHALCDVLTQLPDGRQTAVVFALPVILVVGSKETTTLSGTLTDTTSMLATLQRHGLIAEGAVCHLFPELLHPESLAAISMPDLYRYAETIDDVELGLPFERLPAPVPAKDEAVFVRYVLGIAMQPVGAPPVLRPQSHGAWAMEVMQQLKTQLHHPQVTLFPIPIQPQVLPEALRQGAAFRLEVNMQVFASGIIRKLREHNLPIVAIASAHEGGELRFTISTPGEAKHMAAYAWPLAALDSVPHIVENFSALMKECQVSDVRLIPGIQANEVNGVPFFISSVDPEAKQVEVH